MSEYAVTFQAPVEIDEAIANTLAATTTATLEEICDMCGEYGVKATLKDENGWVKGWVETDGTYRLQ